MENDKCNVYASVRAVPNGTWTDANKQKWLRLTLVVDSIAIGEGKPKFNLTHWPAAIINQLPNLKVLNNGHEIPTENIYVQVPGKGRDDLNRVSLDKLSESLDSDLSWKDAANAVWKTAFEGKISKLHSSLKKQQVLKADPDKDKGNADGDEQIGEFGRPTIGLNSLIEDDDPSSIAQVAQVLQNTASLLSLNFGKININPKEVTWKRFGHGLAVDEPLMISSWATHARPAAAFEAAKFIPQNFKSSLLQTTTKGRGDESSSEFWNPAIDGVLTDEVAEIIGDVPNSLRDTQDSIRGKYRADLTKLLQKTATEIKNNGKLSPLNYRFKLKPQPQIPSINQDPDYLHSVIRIRVEDTFAKAITSISEGELTTFDADVQKQLGTLQSGPLKDVEDTNEKKQANLEIGAYLLSRRLSGLRKMPHPSNQSKQANKSSVKEDVELRKLTAIANHPRLSRFFATAIDIDIKAEALPNAYHQLSAELDTDVPKRFQSITLCFSENDEFRPVSIDEAVSGGEFDPETSEYRDGFLNLQMNRTIGGGKRFALRSMDMRAAVESTLRMGQDVATDRANRVPDEIIDSIAPELRSTGISLIDRDRRGAAIKEQAIASARNRLANDEGQPQYLTTEDLVDGFRFDIGFRDVSRTGTYSGDIEWRPAGDREISYQETIEKLMPHDDDDRERQRPRLRDLDEATIQTPLQIKRSPEEPAAGGVSTFQDQKETSVLANSILQNYEGWSLGLPARASVSMLAEDEMPVSMFYGHQFSKVFSPQNRKVPNSIAKMKFGREYYMRVRLSYIGGGGISWRQAYDFYEEEKKIAIQDRTIPTNGPHVFRRFERVQAPRTLLFEPLDGQEPVLRVREIKKLKDSSSDKQNTYPEKHESAGATPIRSLDLDEAGENNGSQSRHLVVRSFADSARNVSNKEGTGRARRVLVPEEVSVELADFHDVFSDHDKDWPPRGAFPNLRLMPKSGEFPTVDDPYGKLTDFELGDKLGRNIDEQNRVYTGRTSDQIAIPDRNREEPEYPYYPDPMAQRLVLAWVPDHAKSLAEVTIISSKFYEHPTRPIPREALAHLIEIVPSKDGETTFSVDEADVSEGKWDGILAKTFRLAMPPAEQGELHMWCVPDDEAFAAGDEKTNMAVHSSTLDAVPAIAKLLIGALREAHGKPPNEIDETLGPIVINGQNPGSLATQLEIDPALILKEFRKGFGGKYLPPIPNIFPSISMGVVHAAQKPVQIPSFVTDERDNKEEFALVFLKVASEESDPALMNLQAITANPNAAPINVNTTDIRDAFKVYLNNNDSLGRSKWTSQTNGSEGFLAGKIEYHPASTDKLQIWAKWLDYGKDAIKRDPKTGLYSHEPVERKTILCELDQLARPDSNIGLAKIRIEGDKEAIQIKTAEFEPGFARDLKIFVRAFSRYASYFPEFAALAEKKDANASLGAGKNPDPGPFAVDSADFTYCVKAATRPSPPEIREIKPAASTELDKNRLNVRTFKTHYVHRVYLDSWGNFGNEEQLAVILPPKELVRGWNSLNQNIEHLRDKIIKNPKIRGLWDVITLWGADPTEESGKLNDIMGPEDFLNGEPPVEVDLPLNVTESSGNSNFSQTDSITTVRTVIVPFKVEVEPTTGRLYSDIDVRSYAARAIIRFGFVCYQPKSVEKSKVSTPVALDPVQQRPNRLVVIKRITESKRKKIAVTVSGIGYIQKRADWEDLGISDEEIKNDTSKNEIRDRFLWPEMRIRLMGTTAGRREGMELTNQDSGSSICSGKKAARFMSWEALLPNRRDPNLQWNFELPDPGPAGDGEKRYLMLVEQDVYASDPDDPTNTKRIGSRVADRPAGIIRVELD